MNLLSIINVSKLFSTFKLKKLLVLDRINLNIKKGEIISLLGKSGSGKSTLLRIIAGLLKPDFGKVLFKNTQINSANFNISMVFQNFALFPWLTVLENVEIGLESKGINKKDRTKLALKMIDIVGLDGFESAYPKELSGGMKQRVGFARALVVDPELLLMDEPFSSLDILTAENLRNDLLDLWLTDRTNISSILCVTHDIYEAVLISNRILIFSSNPGVIKKELIVDLPYPRDEKTKEFQYLIDYIYTEMMISERIKLKSIRTFKSINLIDSVKYLYNIPMVDVSELIGLFEVMSLHEKNGYIDLPKISELLHLDINNLFPLIEVADMLRFAKVINADVSFTYLGRLFVNADILHRKQLFANNLLKYIPFVKYIKIVLDEIFDNRISEDYFLLELNVYFREDESKRILNTIINWSRYAEIFAYNYDSGELSLENP